MNVDKVVEVLERWSPNGLCRGKLVDSKSYKAPKPGEIVGCAIGCLALEVLSGRKGLNIARDRLGYVASKSPTIVRDVYTQHLLCDCLVLNQKMQEAVEKHFEITSHELINLMSFNDECFPSLGWDPVLSLKSEKDRMDKVLPSFTKQLDVRLRMTVIMLRRRYEVLDRVRRKRAAKIA